ncbi:MAG: exo-alpha-sialidase [Thaumarchaeota archaeon]|nr:exo-alpha-sialidase [Nitrososphaerota archaeon]
MRLGLVLLSIIFLILVQSPYIEAQDQQNFLVVNRDPANRQQVEPSIAIDPLNHDIMVASAQDMRKVSEFGDRWNSYYRSEDGGRTWKNDLIPGYPTDISPEGISSPLKHFRFTSDPVVAFDSSGNAYFVGLAVNRTSGKSAVFVARYSDHGSVYNGTTLVAVGTRDADISLDKPYLFVDNARSSPRFGSIYITWTEVNTRSSRLSIYFAKSTNMARSFSSPLLVSERLDFFNQFSAIATGADASTSSRR